MTTVTRKILRGHPVLIIGAGRGGTALLEMFLDDPLVEVIAIADINPDAYGLKLARLKGIRTYIDPQEALRECKTYADCIIYNLTHDETIGESVRMIYGNASATSGTEAKLIWQMVTKLKRIQAELESSQNQLKAIFDNAMDGIITINEAREIQGMNPAAEKIFGYAQHELLHKNINVLMPDTAGVDFGARIRSDLQFAENGMQDVSRRDMLGVRKSGEQFPAELSASPMQIDGRCYFVGIVRDITERKLAERRIEHMAHHDFLTQLPNRALFMDRLTQALALAQRGKGRIAVLFLDLDDFKTVNDELGHEGGDRLLQEVAARLKALTRAADTVARLGGDEFTIVLNLVECFEDATTLADRIIGTLSHPFDIAGQRRHIGCSIGIAIFPDDAPDCDGLLRAADEAMYLAKESGKNTFKLARDVTT